MLDWKPISTAPHDTVVCTDQGFAVRSRFSVYHPELLAEHSHWYLCDVHGDIVRCADEGYSVSRINEPTKWVSLQEMGLRPESDGN